MQNPEGIADQARRDLSSSYLVSPVKAASVKGVSGFQLSGVARPGSTTNAGGRVEMTALPDPTHNYVDELYLYTPDAQLASTLPVYQNMLRSLEFLPAGSGQPSPVGSPST
jgi:hypothetical protein